MKKGVILTLGNFDGLHVGHRKILLNAIKKGEKEKRKVIAITFWPHPHSFFGKKIKLIQTLEERISHIKRIGVDEVDVLDFDKIVNLSPEDFINFLLERYKIHSIFVGEEFRFGKKREGDLKLLKRIGKREGFYVKGVKIIKYMGEKVSSSLIREYLSNGDLQRARIMLGGFYSVKGKVVKGNKRGKRVKFPTANIKYPQDFLLPNGVYITKTLFNNKYYNSLTHVGPNLTFGEKENKIETFLIDFKSSIYNKEIEIFFVDYIRQIKKFNNKVELSRAISQDLSYALSLLLI